MAEERKTVPFNPKKKERPTVPLKRAADARFRQDTPEPPSGRPTVQLRGSREGKPSRSLSAAEGFHGTRFDRDHELARKGSEYALNNSWTSVYDPSANEGNRLYTKFDGTKDATGFPHGLVVEHAPDDEFATNKEIKRNSDLSTPVTWHVGGRGRIRGVDNGTSVDLGRGKSGRNISDGDFGVSGTARTPVRGMIAAEAMKKRIAEGRDIKTGRPKK